MKFFCKNKVIRERDDLLVQVKNLKEKLRIARMLKTKADNHALSVYDIVTNREVRINDLTKEINKLKQDNNRHKDDIRTLGLPRKADYFQQIISDALFFRKDKVSFKEGGYEFEVFITKIGQQNENN
jgi:uncharacterized small protein (DUF1192 family)